MNTHTVPLLLLFLLLTAVDAGKVRVYVLAGQSNMEGHGEVDSRDENGNLVNGTLLYQLSDPRTKDEFEILWDSSRNDWTVLPHVKIWFNEAGGETGVNGSKIPGVNGKDYSAGNLTVGYGVSGPQRGLFGPELGFGFHLNIPKDDKVLLVKTAWGGKSLAHDFRPPSSAGALDPFCRLPDCNPFIVGHFYRVMLQNVKKLLKPGVIGQIFPDLEGMTAEISGFGWFQGWNDGCALNDTAAYETNMVHLIQDLRRVWKQPHLPVSIGVSGFDGWAGNNGSGRSPPGCWDGPNATKIDCTCDPPDKKCTRNDIVISQLAAGDMSKHPELECCVSAMETRDFWRDADYSPVPNQGYHFCHNAETHYLIGKAMAIGMNRAEQERRLMYASTAQ